MGNPPLAVAPGQPKSSCNYVAMILMQLCGYDFLCDPMHPCGFAPKFAPMLGLLHPNCCLGGLVRVGSAVWTFVYKQSLPLLEFSL